MVGEASCARSCHHNAIATEWSEPQFVSETRGGGKAHLREAHGDVPLCMLQTHREKVQGANTQTAGLREGPRSAIVHVEEPTTLAWQPRWTWMLSTACSLSFAASLVEPSGCCVTWCRTGGEPPSLAELLGQDPRWFLGGDVLGSTVTSFLHPGSPSPKKKNHANEGQKCLFTDGGGRGSEDCTQRRLFQLSPVRHTAFDTKNHTNPIRVTNAWAKVSSKKHCPATPIQHCKRNQTTRHAISVSPEVVEEQVKKKKSQKQLPSVTTRHARH